MNKQLQMGQVVFISYLPKKSDSSQFEGLYIVNVDIFGCKNVCGFAKIGNFACIKIRVLSATASIGYYKSNF